MCLARAALAVYDRRRCAVAAAAIFATAASIAAVAAAAFGRANGCIIVFARRPESCSEKVYQRDTPEVQMEIKQYPVK